FAGKRPGDVRYRTPGSGRRCTGRRRGSARRTWAARGRGRATHCQPRRGALRRRGLSHGASDGTSAPDPGSGHANRYDLVVSDPVNPEDPQQAFYLAQGYFEKGDFANARKWFERRIEMGGADEETFLAMYQVAQSMSQLGTPWPEVQGALLKAWEFRPN